MCVGLWGPLGKGVFLFWESAVVSGVSCVALLGHRVYVCVCMCYAVGHQRSLGGCVCAASLSYVGWEGGGGMRILVLRALGRVLLAID